MKKKLQDTDRELSLFSEVDTPGVQTPVVESTWEFYCSPDIDFIADEAVVAYCYSLTALKQQRPYFYNHPVYSGVLLALKALSNVPRKGVRNQRFTVFAGNVFETNMFVIGVAAQSADVINFLAPYLKNIKGYELWESATSSRLIPVFRYEGGYMIEYVEEGAEGNFYLDDVDNYDSGLVLHWRAWQPADLIGRHRSVYGKLKVDKTILTNNK